MRSMICTNDLFTVDQHIVFEKYGIQLPKEGEHYTIRAVLNTQRGKAYLLNEILNPRIPNEVPDTEGVDFSFEPSWAAWRFREEDEVLENVLELKQEA